MSLINFLNPKLKPAVFCDAVCEDGYTAANLIADDAEQLSRGFMGFSVTKPPIEIVFDLPKAIDLKVIKIWNTNGRLQSTAFEVHGKNDGIWERVAFVRDVTSNVDFVTFCYQSDFSSRSYAETAQQQQSEKAFFFRTANKILSNTNNIKIVISATNKCPPVLRKVQIWGLPARSLEKADRELMKTIWNEITNPYNQQSQDQLQNNGQRSPSRVPELNEYSTLQIPENFLDEITWELMIFPTVLPSGKVVDQSTIDKHSEEEAKWGRMPSDPFTGLEFTSQRKAILNLALKARIEKFLMENSEHFKTVPRSLGSSRVRRSKNRHASQFASPYQNQSSGVGAYSILTSGSFKPASKISATATLSSSTSTSLSLARLSPPPPTKRAKMCNNSATQTLATATSMFATTATLPSIPNAAAATTISAIPNSIDDVIQQALQKITRYTSRTPFAETELANCISCKSEKFAYEIQTCKHLVCRECLVHMTQEKMCTCKTSFRSTDIERYHRL